jgi:hypothetical protein
MLGAIVRKFWPGFYTTDDGTQKLATTWKHYELAACPPYGKASDAVIHKFWVRQTHDSHIFLFIVHDPDMLTHESQTFLMHDCRDSIG